MAGFFIPKPGENAWPYVALGFPAEDPVIEAPTPTTTEPVEPISEEEN